MFHEWSFKHPLPDLTANIMAVSGDGRYASLMCLSTITLTKACLIRTVAALRTKPTWHGARLESVMRSKLDVD
jgi:hypothetical protein